jgi:hypothetical protein
VAAGARPVQQCLHGRSASRPSTNARRAVGAPPGRTGVRPGPAAPPGALGDSPGRPSLNPHRYMGVDVSFEFLGDGLAYGFPEKERPPEVEALQLEALKALRYRLLHVPARVVRHARQGHPAAAALLAMGPCPGERVRPAAHPPAALLIRSKRTNRTATRDPWSPASERLCQVLGGRGRVRRPLHISRHLV